MSNFINATCPRCGTEHEEVPEEYVGEKMSCLNCGREFLVATVEVTSADFGNSELNVACPHCGEANVAPQTAIEHNVRCYACGCKFHLTRKRRHAGSVIKTPPPKSLPPKKQKMSRGKRFVVAAAILVAATIGWYIYGPSLVFEFYETTGWGEWLVEHCYDDETCRVFCLRAAFSGDVKTCEKWAKRVRGKWARNWAADAVDIAHGEKELKQIRNKYR